MKLTSDEIKTQVLASLLSEARAEADGLRAKLQKYEKILRSTRLIMGHELKKPATAISGYLDLAVDALGDLDGEAFEFVRKAQGECVLLNELNKFFLELLRVNSQQEQLHGRKISLPDFLKGIVEHISEDLSPKTRVKLQIAPGIGEFHINPDAFRIILSNIIENALVYSPKKSPVRVVVETEPDRRGMQERDLLKIKVIDKGYGIPKPYLKKIFSPFVRLHQDVAGGSGLGLTLVRSLVELYGGDVYIRSANEKGTTVYLTLPASAESEEDSFVL